MKGRSSSRRVRHVLARGGCWYRARARSWYAAWRCISYLLRGGKKESTSSFGCSVRASMAILSQSSVGRSRRQRWDCVASCQCCWSAEQSFLSVACEGDRTVSMRYPSASFDSRKHWKARSSTASIKTLPLSPTKQLRQSGREKCALKAGSKCTCVARPSSCCCC